MEQRKYGLHMRKPKLKVNDIFSHTILRTSQPANSSNYTHDVKEQDFRYFSLFSSPNENSNLGSQVCDRLKKYLKSFAW